MFMQERKTEIQSQLLNCKMVDISLHSLTFLPEEKTAGDLITHANILGLPPMPHLAEDGHQNREVD